MSGGVFLSYAADAPIDVVAALKALVVGSSFTPDEAKQQDQLTWGFDIFDDDDELEHNPAMATLVS